MEPTLTPHRNDERAVRGSRHQGPLEPGRASVVTGAAWMVGLSLLLFFLPIINGLVGGFVGGMKVGGVKRALTAAVLPALIVAVGLWILLAILDMPIFGLVAGVAIGMWVLLSDLGLFIGAAIGGAVGTPHHRRRVVA